MRITCGNEILSPRCSACPKTDDAKNENWCDGNCYFDENDEICKEGSIVLHKRNFMLMLTTVKE